MAAQMDYGGPSRYAEALQRRFMYVHIIGHHHETKKLLRSSIGRFEFFF